MTIAVIKRGGPVVIRPGENTLAAKRAAEQGAETLNDTRDQADRAETAADNAAGAVEAGLGPIRARADGIERDVALAVPHGASLAQNRNGGATGAVAFFGPRLIAHFDPHSTRLQFNNKPAQKLNELVAKVLGEGPAMPAIAGTSGDAMKLSQENGHSARLWYLASTAVAFVLTLKASESAEWLNGANPTFHLVSASSGVSARRIIWQAGDWRLVRDRPSQFVIAMEENVSGTWTVRGEWRMSNATANEGRLTPKGFGESWVGVRILWRWNRAADDIEVAVNGNTLAPTIAMPAGFDIPAVPVTLYGQFEYAVTMATDATLAEMNCFYSDYIERAMFRELKPERRPPAADPNALLPVIRNPLPIHMAEEGPYADLRPTPDLATRVKGELPDTVMPSAPNVEPFNGTRPDTSIARSFSRPSLWAHPDHPGDPNWIQGHVIMAAQKGTDGGPGAVRLCAVESSDGGRNLDPCDVPVGGGNPWPSNIDNVIDGVTWNNALNDNVSMTLDVRDLPGGGYRHPGIDETFGWIMSVEATRNGGPPDYKARWFGIVDPCDTRTWRRFEVVKHPFPHPVDPAKVQATFFSLDSAFAANGYVEAIPYFEVKQPFHDKANGRVGVILRPTVEPFAKISDFEARSIYFAFSRRIRPVPLDETATGPVPPDKEYQHYDACVRVMSPLLWILEASNYAYLIRAWTETDSPTRHRQARVVPTGITRSARTPMRSVRISARSCLKSCAPIRSRPGMAAPTAMGRFTPTRTRINRN